jgi:transposase
MTDILQLPGWEATGTRTEQGEFIIEAKYTVPAAACIKCGVVGALYRHGTKNVRLRDSPVRGLPAVLDGTVQRYKCRDCERCVQYIQGIAEHVGCVEGTVRNLAAERIQTLNSQFKPYLPEWLGIDETKLDRQMRCIITDVGRNQPIDILADREKPTLARWLHQFKDRSVVKGVAMDMWRPYRDTVKAVIGNVPVVIDKFHVIRMANQAVDKVRIRVQKEKDARTRVAWKRKVAEAYRLKEAFFAIYEMPKAEATQAYDSFLASVPDSMKADFKDLTTAMKNWRTEILAYFDYPITNGYTEALNGVAKVINRAGRGYSFEVMRARILYRTPRPKAEPVLMAAEPVAEYKSPRVHLIREKGNRCDSCGGIYDDIELRATRTGVRYEDKPLEGLSLLCGHCYVRFHTDGHLGNGSLST